MYWPIELATLAAHARAEGDSVVLIDLFGGKPSQLSDMGDHYLQGETIDMYLACDDLKQSDAFILYAISYMSPPGTALQLQAGLNSSFLKFRLRYLRTLKRLLHIPFNGLARTFSKMALIY